MPNKSNTANKDKTYTIIGGIVVAIVVVIVMIISNSNKSNNEGVSKTSISEAQTKCMLMEESDLVNYMGEPFGDATTKKAEEFCLSQWDRTKNPDNTEEKFIEIVDMDWEERKGEVLEGYTLEEYFDKTK